MIAAIFGFGGKIIPKPGVRKAQYVGQVFVYAHVDTAENLAQWVGLIIEDEIKRPSESFRRLMIAFESL